MARMLTKQEIYERMRDWRNLKKLHHAARERVAMRDTLIKKQAEHIRLLMQENALQKKIIETLTLRVEELETMVFGRKKKKDRDPDDDSSSLSSPIHPGCLCGGGNRRTSLGSI